MKIKLYCSECNVLQIEIIKGKARPNLHIVCKKCKERDKSKTEGYDLPDGFSEIFGFGGKK